MPPMSDSRRRLLLFSASALGVALGTVLILRFAFDARIDAPTLGLAAVGVVMLIALRPMFGMVQALAGAGPNLARAEDPRDLGLGRARLREEKKRVLRAIKELDFDHAMGKLSDADYEGIAAQYKLRAVDLLRALDEGDGTLHPELARELSQIDLGKGPDPEKDPVSEAEAEEVRQTCVACEGSNEPDAKFCKHCGEAMPA
jgi:hypothetical protein